MNRSGGGVDSAYETVSAAATLIVTAESRRSQPTPVQKRWGGFLSLRGCFGPPKHQKRIVHPVYVPELAASQAAVSEYVVQVPSIVLPFVAPPSSPESLLHSGAPSETQSPGGLSLAAISDSMGCPGGPASMFAIGPYTYETQLVSPPTFSNLTTEASTTPITPPSDSVSITTPSSPEVPLAFLLDPVNENVELGQEFTFSPDEFESYLISPESPVNYLISHDSGILSPSADDDHFHDICNDGNSKLRGDWTPEAGNPTTKILLGQHLDTTSFAKLHNETGVDNRVSLEITAEQVRKCVEKKEAVSTCATCSLTDGVLAVFREENKLARNTCCVSTNGETDQQHEKHMSLVLEASKEFNFSSVHGAAAERPEFCSDWWADKKVIGGDKGGTRKSWSFFPVTE